MVLLQGDNSDKRIDDETDMKALEAAVRAIEKDGLVWGGGKLVAVGFGIKKLQINLVIEDDKVGLDDLQEEIQEIEEYVQSTDIVSPPPLLIALQFILMVSGCHAKVVERLLCVPFRFVYLPGILNSGDAFSWFTNSGCQKAS